MMISIAIPAYNEEKIIGTCLETVLSYATNDVLEILVIDNASTDRTAEIASRYPKVRVIREPQKGLVFARQCALKEAKGDFLAFLDADTRITENWCSILHREFTKNPKLVCMSGPYWYEGVSRFAQLFAWYVWGTNAVVTHFLTGYMVIGGNFVAKKTALLAMGGFDTRITFYGEDANIARRLHPHGDIYYGNDFFIYSSGRRLKKDGILKTSWIYGMNFLWEAIKKRPYTMEYEDVR
jgi:glycosyltransferase involved in cell wall biosynthesis